MPYRDPTSTPNRTRTKNLLVLGPVMANVLIGALSRFLARRKDPMAQVDRAVSEVREEMGRGRVPTTASYRSQPTPDAVRERREKRRRREAEEARSLVLARPRLPLIVLDTSVVAAAALGSLSSVNSAVVDAVAAGVARLALSDDYLDEMRRTMSKPYLEENASVGRAFRVALVLAYMGIGYRPGRHEWPSIPDRKDWWLLDLAFESGADHIVTWNMRHLAPARSLGFDVLDPPELLRVLR